MAKKLYTLKDPNGQMVKDSFFDKKELAKKARNKLSNDAGFSTDNILHGDAYTVTKGPEHPDMLWKRRKD